MHGVSIARAVDGDGANCVVARHDGTSVLVKPNDVGTVTHRYRHPDGQLCRVVLPAVRFETFRHPLDRLPGLRRRRIQRQHHKVPGRGPGASEKRRRAEGRGNSLAWQPRPTSRTSCCATLVLNEGTRPQSRNQLLQMLHEVGFIDGKGPFSRTSCRSRSSRRSRWKSATSSRPRDVHGVGHGGPQPTSQPP